MISARVSKTWVCLSQSSNSLPTQPGGGDSNSTWRSAAWALNPYRPSVKAQLLSLSSHVTLHPQNKIKVIPSAAKYHCETQMRQWIRWNDMDFHCLTIINPTKRHDFQWFSWMGKACWVFSSKMKFQLSSYFNKSQYGLERESGS